MHRCTGWSDAFESAATVVTITAAVSSAPAVVVPSAPTSSQTTANSCVW